MRQLLFTLIALGLLLAPAAADQITIGERDGKDIVTVRATEGDTIETGADHIRGDFGQYRRGKGSLFVEGHYSAWRFG